MKILVDADACPVKEIVVACAKARSIEVIMVADTSHVIGDGYSRTVTVDKEKDGADFKLVSLAERGDVVVTQDYGVAAMALGKGAKAIHQSGMRYTGENILPLLEERSASARFRRAGGRTRGPKKRTKEDDRTFSVAFSALLDEGGEPG